ncbi:MAG: acyltransferase [Mesorhizobium sp.]|uniref:acyltransferase family protein n=1 Tax=unclassified Mesorhizobium TaxID=325217 RepID=UPI000FCC0574|nr:MULTISPECIES: acyltransferase [unclassified Mesorhizobium]RWF59924.1 MAG: acyltransferase [Mesorhizobium sp.]RVC97454.1 acyltransferase [Mesorhizobium sp. M2A.F.Ca.ET.017.03.2.1]RVD11581.1 acyltransferase [Mesorhizobium sp. M2A.F.Ca.ET.029.05.1.1]TIW58884.1 MAG: acyltransferase [Mesorhizobium sp.]TIW84272.1 MAG: acyltransferase [Mesorhizobium sp.]
MDAILVQIGVIAAAYFIAVAATPMALMIAGQDRSAGRDGGLDGMRGAAAIAVVACHLNQYMCAFLGYASPFVGDHLGILAVQLFFALTAYLFTDKAIKGRLDATAFYLNRLRRILPLYFFVVTVAIAIALGYSWHTIAPLDQTLREALSVLTFGFWKPDELWFRGINMLSLVGIAWTLSYEWLFYAILVPAVFLWRRGAPMRVCIAVGVSALVFREFYYNSEQVIWPFFLPGIVAAILKHRQPWWLGGVCLALALPSLFLIIWVPGFWTPVKLALAAMVFFAVNFGRPTWLSWTPLQTLGMISYSIYLVQYLVLYPSARLIYSSPALAPVEARLGVGAVIVLATIILAATTYRFVERPWLAGPKSTAKRADTASVSPETHPA